MAVVANHYQAVHAAAIQACEVAGLPGRADQRIRGVVQDADASYHGSGAESETGTKNSGASRPCGLKIPRGRSLLPTNAVFELNRVKLPRHAE